jgi:hypothetical protein
MAFSRLKKMFVYGIKQKFYAKFLLAASHKIFYWIENPTSTGAMTWTWTWSGPSRTSSTWILTGP